MSTEQHIDPEVIRTGALALAALDLAEMEGRTEGRRFSFGDKADAVIRAVDEKRREQADEWLYRVCWRTRGMLFPGVPFRSCQRDSAAIALEEHGDVLKDSHVVEAWVERALVGDWERVS